MFWKLCKFEFRNSYRSYGIMYTILLVSTILLRIGFLMRWEGLLPALALAFYGGACIALLILCFVNIVRIYYNSMFKRSAYLTHTLPVKTWQTVLSKIFAGVFWLLVTTLVLGISVMILSSDTSSVSLARFLRSFVNIRIDMTQVGFVILYCIKYLFEVLGFISMLYLVISAAHTKYVHRHRVLASVGFFILGVVIMNIFSILFFFLFESIFIPSTDVYANLSMNYTFWIIINAVIFAFFFIANVYLLDHKMEVE